MWIDTFIAKLLSFKRDNLFNPYVNKCDLHDLKYGPKIRLSNLKNILKFYENTTPQILFVGEALGYRGGKRTGLPFTDDFHLQYWNEQFSDCKLKIATKKPYVKEMTAKIIWKSIHQYFRENLPFLWNICPIQPHKTDNLHSNRIPNKEEISFGKELFDIIVENFKFEKIYSIGKQSYNLLRRSGIDVIYLRHPSYGGSKIFQNQVKDIQNRI